MLARIRMRKEQTSRDGGGGGGGGGGGTFDVWYKNDMGLKKTA